MSGRKKEAASLAGGNAAQGSNSFAKSRDPIDDLLSRLDGVKRTGANTWIARCPSHSDKSPSLSVRVADSSVVLVHCFAGCTVHEVVDAVGMDVSDLFPEASDDVHVGKPLRRPFATSDILRAIAFEALVVGCAATSMAAGAVLSAEDRSRLLVAVERIQNGLAAGGLSHG